MSIFKSGKKDWLTKKDITRYYLDHDYSGQPIFLEKKFQKFITGMLTHKQVWADAKALPELNEFRSVFGVDVLNNFAMTIAYEAKINWEKSISEKKLNDLFNAFHGNIMLMILAFPKEGKPNLKAFLDKNGKLTFVRI